MSDPEATIQLIGELPDIKHYLGPGPKGLIAVDEWIGSVVPRAQRLRLRDGVLLLQDTEPDSPIDTTALRARRLDRSLPEEPFPALNSLSTGYWHIRGLEETPEPDAFRICPTHLTRLDDGLHCTEGHRCGCWMVRVNGRVEFDAQEFKADRGSGAGE